MRYEKLLVISVFLLAALLLRFFFYYEYLPAYHDGQHVRFEASLQEEPEAKSGTQRFKLEAPGKLQAYVITRSFPQYNYGDRLVIDGIFTRREYKGHIFWSIYFPKIQIAKKDENFVTQNAFQIKDKAQNIFSNALPPISSSLLLGIIFGGKHSMPEDFLDKLRTVGVLHVIAASGMNVSFVAGALLFTFGSFMKRQFALILGVVGIILYTFLTGFEPSIIRAAIMAIFAFSASFFGRQHIGVFALFAAGYLMVLWQPSYVFDVGFQLSFLATLGILVIKPLISFKKNVFTEDFGTTLAAQIGTLPILLGVFGKVGIVSLLANVLILWTVPFLMAFGSLSVALGLVFEPLGYLVVLLCLPFLFFFETVVSLFGNVGWILEMESFPWFLVVGYYLVVIAIVVFLQKRKTKHEEEDRLILGN